MSIVANMPKVLEGATPRRPMTAVRKKRIWKARNGLCAWCKKPVPMTGELVRYDHHIPLAIGGLDEDDNIRPLHASPCDKIKTALDKKVIAKVLRLRARLEGQRRKRKAILNAGFSKRLTRGFDGKVRNRNPLP